MDIFKNFIYEYKLLAIFIIILLEYACFPISSEIVLPFSGAIASTWNVKYFYILIISILGGIIGTTLCYLAGKYIGNKLIEKLENKFPKSIKGIEKSKKMFEKYNSFAVCVCRVIPICRTYIALIAGLSNQNIISFITSSLIGISIWNSILIGIGYYMKENWHIAIYYYNLYKYYIMPVILCLIILLIFSIIIKKAQKIK